MKIIKEQHIVFGVKKARINILPLRKEIKENVKSFNGI